jgi:hypothetical protein
MSQPASASSRARLTADVLFVVQLVCGLAFGIGQIVNMFESTQGVSISWFVFWGLFLIINMRLSFQSHQAAPSRVTYQTRIIYVVWTSLMAVNWSTVSVKPKASSISACHGVSGANACPGAA